ncbi:uncharacterized protein LOC113293742 [Papaver somniferum]|uniref:uncharacterized protein LOC113293742 n=1 Tax=Papaver somniferum TaxID=3469 RepID=UPI000E7010E0|nr:uncharacterized protein LOC113293742 [Papaver somniferum]
MGEVRYIELSNYSLVIYHQMNVCVTINQDTLQKRGILAGEVIIAENSEEDARCGKGMRQVVVTDLDTLVPSMSPNGNNSHQTTPSINTEFGKNAKKNTQSGKDTREHLNYSMKLFE